MKALFDTNILIDYLNGIQQAPQEVALYDEPFISLVTWMEVLAGFRPEEDDVIHDFLLRFRVIPIDREVAEEAVRLRRQRSLRLPDAIIWATAKTTGLILVTRNSRDFPADAPGVRVPYTL